MEQPNPITHIALEASKKRLAAAFQRLEEAIDQRLRKALPQKAELEQLHLSLNMAQQENISLSEKFQRISSKYTTLKEVSTDIFHELGTSISTLETMVKTYADS